MEFILTIKACGKIIFRKKGELSHDTADGED